MSFNNVIWSAGNAGKLELSKKLFKEMLSTTNLRPNVYTYGSLVHACAKSKNYKQALLYLDAMKEENLTPNQIVFTSAMEACAEAGKYQVNFQRYQFTSFSLSLFKFLFMA
jgi:pentatricopeptide repeat protein